MTGVDWWEFASWVLISFSYPLIPVFLGLRILYPYSDNKPRHAKPDT